MQIEQTTTPTIFGLHALIDPLRCGVNYVDVINVGSSEWFSWLEQNEAFTVWLNVDGGKKLVTCRLQERKAGLYWYAYARDCNQRLHCYYLGRTADLTQQRLEGRVNDLLVKLELG